MTSRRPWRMLTVVFLVAVAGSVRAAEVDKYVPDDTTAVLTRDILAESEVENLAATKVVLTVVGGRIVYESVEGGK